MENTIDLLEKRLAALEVQILPDGAELDLSKITPIIDCLMEAHGMIGTALSCRESVASILRYLPQISEWLDPSYECQDAAERKQYLLDLCPELQEGIALLQEFVKLREVLESNYFTSVNDLSDRVDKLTISAINTHKDSENVTQKVLDDLQLLQEVTASFKTLFAQLECNMSALEESAKPKQTIDG